jgi:hypothetical protein
MNFCCHDDYTDTGSFDLNDINIYSAHQSWVLQGKPLASEDDSDKAELIQFKNWYASKNALGQLPNLSEEIKFLPKMDCGDFTETGSFDLNDINIYSAHQSWVLQGKPLASESDSSENECTKFTNWYDSKNALGQLANLSSDIQHLPSLQADTVVHTINGDVPRGGDADAIIVDVDAEGDTAGDLLVSFDATAAVHTNENYAGENRIKAVELVFDNIEFVPTSETESGLSLNTSEKQTLIDEQYQDTLGNKTLNYYYDYAMRTDGTEPRNNKSVIGFIDTTANGDGELKTTLGTLVFRVKKDNWRKNTEISNDIKIADVRIWDETCEVERYELQGGCG